MLHYARLTNQSSRAGCHLTITNDSYDSGGGVGGAGATDGTAFALAQTSRKKESLKMRDVSGTGG